MDRLLWTGSESKDSEAEQNKNVSFERAGRAEGNVGYQNENPPPGEVGKHCENNVERLSTQSHNNIRTRSGHRQNDVNTNYNNVKTR